MDHRPRPPTERCWGRLGHASSAAPRLLPLATLAALAALAAACDRARPIVADEIPPCERCHGGNGSAAPPRSARGGTETSDRGVGAHARHLALQGDDVRAALPCETCHVVPTSVDGHLDGLVPVRFLDPAAAGGSAARWDAAAGRCENVYCHGATLRDGTRGTATAPQWTLVDGSQTTCGSCHGAPPDSHAAYPGAASCHVCHAETVKADGTIDLASGTHVDGAVQGPSGTGCAACHGAPPATGAHRVHANPADPSAIAYGGLTVLEDAPGGGTSYDFGCGHCHPVDPADHFADAGGDGAPDVVLVPPPAPVAGDEIKARNAATAAWDGAAGTCAGVYCHSSGQATPAYAATPAWTAAPGALGCGGCHGNPPRYPSGGPGEADANSHLVIADDGWESGHFQGMPGYWHTSKHGGNWSPENDAAPITCQACHADTVDPAATGPSGFYWLDTTGDYRLPVDAPGADPSRASSSFYAYLQCTACHDGVLAPVGAGAVLPLRHVNGTRDVAFDARTALPVLSWLPAPPNAPTRPYWVTRAATGITFPDPRIPDAVMDGSTLSAHLGSARYEGGSTKTCTNVSCHLLQTQVSWGAPHGWAACSECHPF